MKHLCLSLSLAVATLAAVAVRPAAARPDRSEPSARAVVVVVTDHAGRVLPDPFIGVQFDDAAAQKPAAAPDGAFYVFGVGDKITIEAGHRGLTDATVELGLTAADTAPLMVVEIGLRRGMPALVSVIPAPAESGGDGGPAPGNDFCEDAIAVAVPSTTSGSTSNATDDGVDFCGTSNTAAGVWYSVVGTGNTMTATTCDNPFDYDTKISVFCGSCDDLTCVDGNDDDCPAGPSGLLSTVDWCSQTGAGYLILVHGFGGATGAFDLDVSDDGAPCAGGVSCIPTGACCLAGGACVQTTGDDCAAQGGGYLGDGTACVGGYESATCANPFEDISGSGIQLFLGDDAGEVVPIGFTFNFFGGDRTMIAVTSNGYLTFGGDLTDFTNDPIPTASDPNDFIAPFWDDLDPGNAGSPATVHYETLGAAPDRRFIAQWTDVPEFPNEGSNTFQAVLYEGSNCIEFRYGDFTANVSGTDVTVGVENQDGTDGLAIDASTIAPGVCLEICPLESPCDVVGACCVGADCLDGVTEADCDAEGGEYQGDGTSCSGSFSATSSPGIPVPSVGTSGTASDTLIVADDTIISDLDVDVNISHTWIGDLEISLIHDDTGTTVLLIDNQCGNTDDMDVTFDDEGGAIACAAPLTGIIDPVSAGGAPLAGFDGESSAGSWTLFITDTAGGDSGTLNSWTLDFEGEAASCVVTLPLDIKPGSCPNSLNRTSNGVIPVGLLGTDTFDITQVDVATVVISRADGVGGSVGPNEGPPGPHSVFADVGTPLSPNGVECGCHTLEGDGITDLSMKFRTQDVVDALQLGDFSGGDFVELVVSGQLDDGTPFTSSDCVRIVPPGSPMLSMAVSATAGAAWVEASPMDLLLDGGGFANFMRTYMPDTPVTLTASPAHAGQSFIGWRVDGGTLISGQTLQITATGGPQSIEAIYVELVQVDERPIDASGRPIMQR